MDPRLLDLSLLLIYLTGWEEDKRNGKPGEKIFFSWSQFQFKILNKLQEQKMLVQTPKGKILILTENGKRKAEEIKQKLAIA